MASLLNDLSNFNRSFTHKERTLEVELCDYLPAKKNHGNIIKAINSNYRFASFCIAGKVQKPSFEEYNLLTSKILYKCNLKCLSTPSLISAYKDLESQLKFKKQAAILPSEGFVKKLAKQAFEMLMELKPKNISKAIASLAHSKWFDYALDKNIYLSSLLYTELREKYLPAIKKEFGVSEIQYIASTKEDRELSVLLNEVYSSSNVPSNIVKKAAEICASTDEHICQRLLLLSDLLGFPENYTRKLAALLNKESGLEFSFML